MYLENVNAKLNSIESSYLDVIHLVSEEVLLADKEFFNFIYTSNNLIAESQTEAMLQMLQVKSDQPIYNDPSLIEQCLQQWNVIPKTEIAFDCTFGQWAEIVYSPENSLSQLLPLRDSFNLPGDKLANEWHCVRIENINNIYRTFFSSKNSTEVKMLHSLTSEWIAIPNIGVGLEFPTNTFVYGELVNHHVRNADTTFAFHIIDGLVLNGQDIRSHPYSMRLELCKKFADAINNPSRFMKIPNGENVRSAAVCCKETFLLKDLIPEMDKIRNSLKTTQSGSKIRGHNVQTFIGPKCFYPVNGLLFLRNFPTINNETNFNETFQCRQLWNWCQPDILSIVNIEETPADGNVYLSHFCKYMNRTIVKDCVSSKWRLDKNKQQTPSRYTSNRGGGRSGAQGRGGRGFKK